MQHFVKDEKNYIEFIKFEVDLFDCITMMINLLHIKCLRQFRLYIAEENETNYDLFILKNKFFYYFAVKGFMNPGRNIPILNFDGIATEYGVYSRFPKDQSLTFKIPNSCFWETSKLNDPYVYLAKIFPVCKLLLMQNYKIRNIRNVKLFYERDCKKYENILLSRIGQNGIEHICKTLFQNFNYFVNATQFLSLASMSDDDDILKSIDLKHTIDFNENIILVFVNQLGLIPANEMYLADQRWIIYKNDNHLKEYKTIFLPNSNSNAIRATRYAADNFLNNFLGAVSEVLNKQLDILNADTINLYTDDVNINGIIKKRFTINSLIRLINDDEDDPHVIQNLQTGIIQGRQLYQQLNPSDDNQTPNINTKRMLFKYYEENIIHILKTFLDINIYIFYMFSLDYMNLIRLDSRVKIKDVNNPATISDETYIVTKIIKEDGKKTKYKLDDV